MEEKRISDKVSDHKQNKKSEKLIRIPLYLDSVSCVENHLIFAASNYP